MSAVCKEDIQNTVHNTRIIKSNTPLLELIVRIHFNIHHSPWIETGICSTGCSDISQILVDLIYVLSEQEFARSVQCVCREI